MKKINIIKLIEDEGYEVLEFDANHLHKTKEATFGIWAKVMPLGEKKDNCGCDIFETYISLEMNGYGDLVITLWPVTDENFVWEGIEPDYNSVGRPKKVMMSEIIKLKNEGYTQEKVSRELNVSLSTVRRNWK